MAKVRAIKAGSVTRVMIFWARSFVCLFVVELRYKYCASFSKKLNLHLGLWMPFVETHLQDD